MRRTRSCTRLTVYTIAAVTLQILGLSLFVFGFFPVKPALSGYSGPESFYPPGSASIANVSESEMTSPKHLQSLYQELSGIPPTFDRLILMVIDGLPAEFLLGKNGQPPRKDLMEAMPYTQSLLSSGMAIGYHAKAAPPTVTMPRLKAMVSGAIGGFLDVAFNFNTQALLDDNLLDQFLRIGWKMVMLGDETWLKLFPGIFMRHDGVSSFFVKDTVQVDQNVSRHLRNELGRDDWNLLILHYLGLDHVGHIGGRSSHLMGPKLMEMDEVVKLIHLSTVNNQDTHGGKTLLVVVSDHGMTENGNHGGSSYEETDSLMLFIGLERDVLGSSSANPRSIQQVDIAPTLALLFGVPIPKNNVGVVIPEIIKFLRDEEHIRVLELNSWQLLRLVQAQLSGMTWGDLSRNGITGDLGLDAQDCSGSIGKMLCCFYFNAVKHHSTWKSDKSTGDEYNKTIAAYNEFLNSASEWLSRRVTDKPISLLALGVVAMVVSCVILLSLISWLSQEVFPADNPSNKDGNMHGWALDETFIFGGVLLVVMSMGSSSMVEEEQYIWHFLLSTSFLLFLRKTVQNFKGECAKYSFKVSQGLNFRSNFQLYSIILLLTSGRILRAWHQGGVNWTHLPDISKWLEQAWSHHVRSIQLVSVLLVVSVGLCALSLCGCQKKVVQVVGFCFLASGILVLWHVMEYQDSTFASSSFGATMLAQVIYACLGISTTSVAVLLPWVIPVQICGACSNHDINSATCSPKSIVLKSPVMEFRDSSYMIGLVYMLSWSLLQLLLQQPINAMPIFLLLIQILAVVLFYSLSSAQHKEWVKVALLYYMGMTGHFALGNSNTLATIDVAGAFIGLSNHSTFFSGILMFIITYASPMLVLLSVVLYISVKDSSYLATPQDLDGGHFLKKMLGYPCLVPLGLNSIFLTTYTITLLIMRNHLFVWSVFSPKFLYVVATTVCVYIGVLLVAATGAYIYLVLTLRRRRHASVVS